MEYAEDLFNESSLQRRPSKKTLVAAAAGRSTGGKSSADSSSTSPDHKRDCSVVDGGGGGSTRYVQRSNKSWISSLCSLLAIFLILSSKSCLFRQCESLTTTNRVCLLICKG